MNMHTSNVPSGEGYYVTTTRAAFKNYVSQEWAHCHIQLLSFLFFYRWTNEWRWRLLNGISGNLSSRELKWKRMMHSRWRKDRRMKQSTQYVVFSLSLCDLTADILHAITLQQCHKKPLSFSLNDFSDSVKESTFIFNKRCCKPLLKLTWLW